MLSQQHRHSRDERICFIPNTHTYLVDGSSEGIISVTSLIHRYFPSFDAARVLSRMSSSTKQQRYGNLSDLEIQKKWREDGKRSAERGTALHLDIERFYNGEHVNNTSLEFMHFLAFHETVKDYVPYRTEWSIFDGEIDLAGQLDMLYRKGDGTYALYDWKCVKEIKRENAYEKGNGVCSLLDHCNYSHYSLQLHIYKKILETRYDLTVSEMRLVVLHPDHPEFILYELADVSDVVDKIFQERRNIA